jgi:hypothetical protein
MNNNDWVLIYTHDQKHKIMLLKEFLLENGISEVAEINKKGSMLLIGTIELYVKKEEEKKAKKLVEEFDKKNED